MARFEPVVPEAERIVYDEWLISPAVKVGDFVFCSGALGIKDDGTIPTDPREQFEQAFSNLGRLLTEAGATFEDVFELLTFHIDLAHVEVFNEVKSRLIHEPHPAWTAIGVAELGGPHRPGLLVEIKATAYVG
jgi:enamine deaminase RidA (YjgF/YER057c/UK114 family)